MIKPVIYMSRTYRASMVVDGLEDIARLLNMSNVPRRIEGYDISHIQGFGAVVCTLAFNTSPMFCEKSPIFS
jgi:excinuclease ABC subunit C